VWGGGGGGGFVGWGCGGGFGVFCGDLLWVFGKYGCVGCGRVWVFQSWGFLGLVLGGVGGFLVFVWYGFWGGYWYFVGFFFWGVLWLGLWGGGGAPMLSLGTTPRGLAACGSLRKKQRQPRRLIRVLQLN